MPEQPRYTVEPGRYIYRDGKPFIYIGLWSDKFSDHYVDPAEVDTLTHEFCAYLNERGHDGARQD